MYRTAYELDAWGERISKRYLGPEDSPITSGREGFHETRYRRDDFGNSIEWGYYGVNGERVICPIDGIAFGRFELNEYGSDVRLDNYGVSGERRMSRHGYATRRTKRDATETPIEWSHFDVEGAPVARNFGHSILVSTRDARGNATRELFLDPSGHRVRTREGYAEARHTFDERDNSVSSAYFDEHGKPTLVVAGYHKKSTEFDGDRETRVVYTDEFGSRTNIKLGYAERFTIYEDGGAVARYEELTAAGVERKPLPRCTGTFDPAHDSGLGTAFSKLAACSEHTESRTLILRVHVDQDGRTKSFVALGPHPRDATTDCLRAALSEIHLPPPNAGCANLTLELTPGQRRVRVLTFGDTGGSPELPPG